jgi:hypothetical protein
MSAASERPRAQRHRTLCNATKDPQRRYPSIRLPQGDIPASPVVNHGTMSDRPDYWTGLRITRRIPTDGDGDEDGRPSPRT